MSKLFFLSKHIVSLTSVTYSPKCREEEDVFCMCAECFFLNLLDGVQVSEIPGWR